MTKLLERLHTIYFKAKRCFEDCFIAITNKEGIFKEQQTKNDMLSKHWYSMVET